MSNRSLLGCLTAIALACQNTNRDFIGAEIDPKYYEIAKERIKNEISNEN